MTSQLSHRARLTEIWLPFCWLFAIVATVAGFVAAGNLFAVPSTGLEAPNFSLGAATACAALIVSLWIPGLAILQVLGASTERPTPVIPTPTPPETTP